MKLSDKEWKDFFLEDIFSVGSGKRLTNADKIDGTRPFIGATDNMNGVTGFVDNENSSLDKNVLGVNYNGAPCIGFYHPYECIFTDDVKRLHLKNHEDNQYVLLFLKTVIFNRKINIVMDINSMNEECSDKLLLSLSMIMMSQTFNSWKIT